MTEASKRNVRTAVWAVTFVAGIALMVGVGIAFLATFTRHVDGAGNVDDFGRPLVWAPWWYPRLTWAGPGWFAWDLLALVGSTQVFEWLHDWRARIACVNAGKYQLACGCGEARAFQSGELWPKGCETHRERRWRGVGDCEAPSRRRFDCE